MNIDTRQECETLKKQLEGYKEISQTFIKMATEVSQEQREELMCHQIKKMSGAEEVALLVLNPKTERFHFRTAIGKQVRKYAGGFLDLGADDFHAFWEPNPQAAYSQEITIQTKSDIHTFYDKHIMVIPVKTPSKVYGMFFCEYDGSYAIDDNDRVELMRVFLAQLSPLFEHFVEKQRFEDKAKSLELLYEIGNKLSNIRDEDQLLENILQLIEKYIQVDRCSLLIIDEDRKHLRIKKAFGISDVDIRKVKVPLGVGIAGHVAMGKRPLLIKDIATEKHLISSVRKKENFRTSSLLSVPLVSQEEVIGVINVNNRKDGLPFSEEDMELLSKIGSEIAAVLKRSYLALQLKKARELHGDIKRATV